MALHGLRGGSVAQALSQTFDGQHPCKICLRIKAASSDSRLVAPPSPKAEFFPPLGTMVLTARRSPVEFPESEISQPTTLASPDLQPPKALPA
jgi:hypothetical protein